MECSSSIVNENNNNNGNRESSRVIRVWSARDKSAADEHPVAPRTELGTVGLGTSGFHISKVLVFSRTKKAEPAREIPAGRLKMADLSKQPGREAKLVAELKAPAPRREPCVLNEVGLPLRPGEEICWNYENLGLCKSGRACAFDHPPGLRAPAIIRETMSKLHLGETAKKSCL